MRANARTHRVYNPIIDDAKKKERKKEVYLAERLPRLQIMSPPDNVSVYVLRFISLFQLTKEQTRAVIYLFLKKNTNFEVVGWGGVGVEKGVRMVVYFNIIHKYSITNSGPI